MRDDVALKVAAVRVRRCPPEPTNAGGCGRRGSEHGRPGAESGPVQHELLKVYAAKALILRVAPRHLIEAGAVLVAVVALAGCAGAQSGAGAIPYPGGTWSASTQDAFMTACDAEADITYCACALGDVMQQHPNASRLHRSVSSRGTTAGKSSQPFPDCANQ